MPKGNATKYAFPLSMTDGKLNVGHRTLMVSSKVVTDVVKAAEILRRGESVYLEAYGSNLGDVERLINGETE